METFIQQNSIIELISISSIVGLEFYFFMRILGRIRILESLFPKSTQLSIVEGVDKSINKMKLEETLEDGELDLGGLAIIEKDQNLDLIACSDASTEFSGILQTTNNYLKNNINGVVDFNIVREISELVDTTIERNISSMISIPLYIGLLGTVAGIIYSLFSVDLNSILESGGISMFLNGVKIAMFANFFGLFFTLLNTAFFMKKAVFARDTKKAAYYSFVQSNLLPKVSSDISSSMKDLQASLDKFNVNFGQNIRDFNANTKMVSQNLQKQDKLLQTINDIGLERIIQANLLLFGEFNKNVNTFQQFTENQKALIHQFEQFKSIIFRLDQIMQNVVGAKEYIESSLVNIDKRIGVADELYQFLRTQYSNINNIGDSTNILMSSQNERLESLFESYQQFLKGIVQLNNEKVQTLIQESEDNIKQLMVDKDFLSLNTNVRQIIKEIPSIKNHVSKINTTVENTSKELDTLKEHLLTTNETNNDVKEKPRIKNIWPRLLSIFYRNEVPMGKQDDSQ